MVFWTSTSPNLKQFALKGYEVEAMDFLVEPVSYSAFKTMLGRVNRRVENTASDSITITNAKGAYRLRTSDIYYIEIIKHYLVIHTVGGEKQFFGSLSDIEKKLPQKSFARCNNCYLVNLAWVEKVGQEDVYVGGDAMLSTYGTFSNPTDQTVSQLQRAAKSILYTVSRSSAMYSGVSTGMPVYKLLVIIGEVVPALLLVGINLIIFLPRKKKKKKGAD